MEHSNRSLEHTLEILQHTPTKILNLWKNVKETPSKKLIIYFSLEKNGTWFSIAKNGGKKLITNKNYLTPLT